MSRIPKILSILFLFIYSVKCQHIAEQGGKALYNTPGLSYGNQVDEKSSQYISPPGYPVPIAMQNSFSASPEYYPASTVQEPVQYSTGTQAPDYNSYNSVYMTTEAPHQPAKDEKTHSYVQEEDSEDGDMADDDDKDTKQDGSSTVPAENPLNFLNLLGTDFQPGRLVNIFFGLFIMMFMLIAQGYAMWVFGIAFLPGTRSLNDWKIDSATLDTVLTNVIDAFEYWEDKQINNRIK